MKELLVVTTLFWPLAMMVAGLLLSARPGTQRVLALAAAGGHLISTLVLGSAVMREGAFSLMVGGWKAPYGIALRVDHGSVLAMAVAGLVALVATPHTESPAHTGRPRRDLFPFFPLLLFGATGAAMAGDLFNLYVWFEVMLVGSFVLLTYGGGAGQIRAALIYVSLNLLASAFYLVAVALLYGGYGSLHLGDLSGRMAEGTLPFLHPAAWGFLLVFFFVKMAAFPFFAWLPTAYPRPPIAVAALFSGILTKLAFFCLARLWGLLGPPAVFAHVLVGLGALTLLSGLSAALVEREPRRFTAWLLAGEMGYLLLALGVGGESGVTAGLFLLVHTALATTFMWLLIGHLEVHSAEDERGCPRGLRWRHPVLAAAIGLVGLVLMGIPPFSGFLGKLALLRAGFSEDNALVVFSVLFASLLALVAIGRFWLGICGGHSTECAAEPTRPRLWGRLAATVVLGVTVLALPLFAADLYQFCGQAADDLLAQPSIQTP